MHSLGLLLFLFAAGTDTVIQQRWHMSPTARAAWARLHVALELGPGGHLELERVDHGAEPFAIEFWSRSPVPSEPESRTTNPNPWICVGARCCCIANPAPPPRAAGGSAWQQFVVAFGQSTSQPSPRLMAIDGSTHTNQSCVALPSLPSSWSWWRHWAEASHGGAWPSGCGALVSQSNAPPWVACVLALSWYCGCALSFLPQHRHAEWILKGALSGAETLLLLQ